MMGCLQVFDVWRRIRPRRERMNDIGNIKTRRASFPLPEGVRNSQIRNADCGMRNGGPPTVRAVNYGWRVEIQNGVAAPLPHLAAVLQKCRRVHLLCAAGRVRGGSPVILRNP